MRVVILLLVLAIVAVAQEAQEEQLGSGKECTEKAAKRCVKDLEERLRAEEEENEEEEKRDADDDDDDDEEEEEEWEDNTAELCWDVRASVSCLQDVADNCLEGDENEEASLLLRFVNEILDLQCGTEGEEDEGDNEDNAEEEECAKEIMSDEEAFREEIEKCVPSAVSQVSEEFKMQKLSMADMKCLAFLKLARCTGDYVESRCGEKVGEEVYRHMVDAAPQNEDFNKSKFCQGEIEQDEAEQEEQEVEQTQEQQKREPQEEQVQEQQEQEEEEAQEQQEQEDQMQEQQEQEEEAQEEQEKEEQLQEEQQQEEQAQEEEARRRRIPIWDLLDMQGRR